MFKIIKQAFSFKPSMVPSVPQEVLVAFLKARKADPARVHLIGLRGFFTKENERKKYDDAIILYTPAKSFGFNANCDPGAFKKGIANLVEGTWLYQLGIHGLSKPKWRQYMALVQAARVTVKRDQSITESGRFGINIHKGGLFTVSSLGCQTIYPSQWDDFYKKVSSCMSSWKMKTIEYHLAQAKEIES